MGLIVVLVFLAGPLLGIAWLVLEFKGSRAQRVTCGLLALATLTAVASMATQIVNQFNYNAWYGSATHGLVDETIRGIEAGNTEVVLRELKRFQEEYRPTYENRANYVPLAEQATERMKEQSLQPETPPQPEPAGPAPQG